MNENLVARASVLLNVPSAKAWDALINPETIRQYMFGAQIFTDWREGGPIVWKGEWKGKPYEDKGTVLRVIPGKTLQYLHFSPLSGQPDTPENQHTVTVELYEEGKQTRLSLTQDHNATEEARDHSQKNWEGMLASLKKIVEAGTR